MLATQLISRLRTAFSLELPLRLLFEVSTVAGQARAIEEALKGGAEVTAPPLLPLAERSRLPLSFAQQRLWFLDQLEPGSTAYNMPTGLRLLGELNVAALERSFTEVVRRHEVLRTRIESVAGTPLQVLMAAEAVHLPVVDLRMIAEAERAAIVRQMAVEEAHRVFDLSRGGLLRQTLLRLGVEEHVLLFTMHHIVSDGWSMEILTREVSALYEAYAAGQESPLPELPIQYADYAVWQREWLQGEVLEEQLGYWRQQLAGAQAVLELPTDRVRPAQQSHRGASLSMQLGAELTASLKQLSQREGVTLFMTLLASWQLLLARYSRQPDIVVGSPIANRTRSEVEGLIGFFVNTLVLRTEVAGELSVRELLQRVREVCLGAYGHQEVPFEMLVEQLQPERDQSHTPLFQVMFNLLNLSANASGANGERMNGRRMEQLRVESFASAEGLAAKFDLTLNAQEQNEQLFLGLSYNTELFEEGSIRRLLGHLQNILESFIADPEQRLSELSLLTAGEEKQVLHDWNQTQAQLPQRLTIDYLFYQQVKRTPSAVAVSDERQQLTYAELNARANSLAGRLRRLGVGPEVLVGIMMERSVEMVVALLAVLKSGGAYVPLDVRYPQERLRFMMEDAALKVVIVQAAPEVEVLATGIEVISVNSEDWTTATEAEPYHESGVVAENPAYIIYTSGSTGLPKGVMIPHSAICNHMLWMLNAFPLEQADRVLQKTPISFDASVWEFYAPLLSGAQLVMADPEPHMDGRFLIEQIRKNRITTIQLVPSLLKLCLDEPDFRKCHSLTRVFCGGEALTADLVSRFKESGLSAELYNLYGPSETTIDATYSHCEIDPHLDVSIGRPISNTDIYLLDKSMRPVPIGVPGEIYIGGLNLARGYLRRPELTALNFVPHPFSAEPGARLYKTGDLARYRPDGQLQYLGRVDSQVKLRGFRIELEEIASLVRQHGQISDAVVLLRRSSTGDERLVSYVVGESAPTQRQLRSYLQKRLPEYMIPARMVLVNEIPLLPNGKVDRRALEMADAEEWGRDQEERHYVGPRNPAEEKLVSIWEKVLGVHTVGVEDNFFEMGGHSLLATQLISRIRDEFKIDIPLRSVFGSPTPAEMARVIEAAIIEELEGITEEEIHALAG